MWSGPPARNTATIGCPGMAMLFHMRLALHVHCDRTAVWVVRHRKRSQPNAQEGNDNVNQCYAVERSCDQSYGRRARNSGSVLFRRRDMGHPLPHGRNRRLAWRPAGADLAILRGPCGLAGQAIGRGANEKAGREEPRHQHAPANFTAARGRIPRVLRVSLLLGWSLYVGPGVLPGGLG